MTFILVKIYPMNVLSQFWLNLLLKKSKPNEKIKNEKEEEEIFLKKRMIIFKRKTYRKTFG